MGQHEPSPCCELKRIKQSAEKEVPQAVGQALNIPTGNLVLLCDHP